MAEHDHFENQDQEHGGYEPDRVNVRAILTFAVALVAVVIVTFVVLAGMMFYYFRNLDSERQERQPPLFADKTGQYAGPRLQHAPGLDMQRLREETNAQLNSYGWIDRESGVARIPIERAIELVSQTGLPAREEEPDTPTLQDVDSGDPPRDAPPADDIEAEPGVEDQPEEDDLGDT